MQSCNTFKNRLDKKMWQLKFIELLRLPENAALAMPRLSHIWVGPHDRGHQISIIIQKYWVLGMVTAQVGDSYQQTLDWPIYNK